MSSSSSSTAPSATIPWVEKYRPKNLSEVSHQEEVVATLKRSLETGNLPHLLFYGPPGTGKTTTVLAVARELFGPDLMKRRILELNASNERGIDVIRHKVKEFASGAVGTRDNVPGYPCPPYKLIILDEADSMTKDAQSALRRTMEQFTSVTRFCILCNYVSRIIEPITSRCAKFRFKPIESVAMRDRLHWIADKENIQFAQHDGSEEELVKLSGGDMRKAINLLQTSAKFLPTPSNGSPAAFLTVDHLRSVSGGIPADLPRRLIESTQKNSFAAVEAMVKECHYEGFPVDLIYQGVLQFLLTDPTIQGSTAAGSESSALLTSAQIGSIALQIAESEKRLIEGADEYLQLLDCMSCISKMFSK